MYLHQLYVFYHVAKHRSFSRAAEGLCLTQPSVSTQVKILEEAYKTKLFERSGRRRIELTDAGNILFSYLEKSFNLIKEGESAVENTREMKYGHIKISAIPTLVSYYLPPIIERFRNTYSHIEIQLMGDFQENVIDKIISLEADLGFIGKAISHESIAVKRLWDEELVIIVPPSHPFAKKKAVRLDQLKGQPFILCEKGSGTREIIDTLVTRKRLLLNAVMEIGDNEAQKSMVAAGLGISIISSHVAKRDVEEGRLKALRVIDEKMHRTFYAIHHKNKYITHTIGNFLSAVSEFPFNPVAENEPR
jgi:DNA-binding transcriptional LysR family regulator